MPFVRMRRHALPSSAIKREARLIGMQDLYSPWLARMEDNDMLRMKILRERGASQLGQRELRRAKSHIGFP